MRCEANELQTPEECSRLGQLLQDEGVRSYLEIGSRFGGSLWSIVNRLPKGSKAVSVDIKFNGHLEQCVGVLNSLGYHAQLIIGDSRSTRTSIVVGQLGPYDAVFIDGMHTKEHVENDWNIYGQMGRIVAFHDISMPEEKSLAKKPWKKDVPLFWESLKTQYRHQEIKTYGGIGIGVLWRW